MSDHRLSFGPFVFDLARGLLFERDTPVAIGSKGLALLRALVAAGGDVVARDVLMDAAWPNTSVEESNLTVQMAQLRKRLGSSADSEEWIGTVPRVGYRFVGELSTAAVQANSILDARFGVLGISKPSIAVLPFNNMSSDPEQEYFADGLSEDLITDLSKVPGLLVIARNSSFAYKGKSSDVRQVARELGVRYIIEGSVRRAADRVRINAQIIDAIDHSHVWADRFDRKLADVFALQDEIVGLILNALAGTLPAGVSVTNRRTTNLEAYDLFVRGRVLALLTPGDNHASRPLLEKALGLDPAFAEAQAWVALSHTAAWLYFGEPMEAHLALALEGGRRAVALDPDNADARAAHGYVLTFSGDPEDGAAELARALRLNPNHADAWVFSGEVTAHRGYPLDGLVEIASAMRLNPNPPGYYYWILGYVQYMAGRYEEAVATLSHESTRRTASQRLLAASLAQLGRLDEARRVGQEFLALVPRFSIDQWSRSQPIKHDHDRQRFIDGYTKAGLPLREH
jgi:TolB-like protein/Flp pilus assembly protein TadD